MKCWLDFVSLSEYVESILKQSKNKRFYFILIFSAIIGLTGIVIDSYTDIIAWCQIMLMNEFECEFIG